MARALHLVDIDNLLGDPATDDEDKIGWTIHAYQDLASVVAGDHVVVATSPFGRHAVRDWHRLARSSPHLAQGSGRCRPRAARVRPVGARFG